MPPIPVGSPPAPALPCPKDKDAIFHCARNYLDKELREAKTFKVETRRSSRRNLW